MVRPIALAAILLGLSLTVPPRQLETRVDSKAVHELAPGDRAWAAHQLGHLDPPEPGLSVPVLMALLADPVPLVRARAAEGLSHFDGNAEMILTRLQPALHDADPLVRESAFVAVSRLAPAGDSMVALKAGLQDNDPVIRKEAESALRRISASR